MMLLFLYVFICVFCYVPCKEGAEFPCHRLMSRLISCSSIVTLSMVFIKSRNSQRVLPCVADLYRLRTGSDQPSLFTCGLNTGD